MPRYLIERNPGVMTPEQLNAVGQKVNQVLEGMPGLAWVRSYVSEAEGKVYCEFDAPNAAAVREHSSRAGLPITRIMEVALEINPTMFR